MLVLSGDAKIAEQQMIGLIFCLTCFGYIDGEFDPTERQFVEGYIDKVIRHHADAALINESEAERTARIGQYTAHFRRVFERLDKQLGELSTEIIADGETQFDYVKSRLELQAYELFKCFDRAGQKQLMDTVDELLMADGHAHPAELAFRQQLQRILDAEVPVDADPGVPGRPTNKIGPLIQLHSGGRNNELLASIEVHYSPDVVVADQQLTADTKLAIRAMRRLQNRREAGVGKLAGHQSFAEFDGAEPFLDGHVSVFPPKDDESYELTVLGDLHGCYSCLKAAVIQSRFVERVAAYEKNPSGHPRPMLVLLGDYVDRGFFSFHGVLRGVLRLYAQHPDYVTILRGNHEFYVEHGGDIFPAVNPADALNTLKTHAPVEVQRTYKHLFDSLPSMLVFGRLCFVHGGIPKNKTIQDKYTDLASLNEPIIRLEMMWGDPSTADAVPDELQAQAARFAYGKEQCRAFIHRLGLHTLIRAHKKYDPGFGVVYDDDSMMLLTLFSAGGEQNDDLPIFSNYRYVEPKALTLRYFNGEVQIDPWNIDYQPYCTPELNAFYASEPFIKATNG